jgi:heterodisulfide reductase subunit D
VAVGCPFCLTMLNDGIAETGREGRLRVLDVAEIVAGACAALPAETRR